jgi:hypothetical protein
VETGYKKLNNRDEILKSGCANPLRNCGPAVRLKRYNKLREAGPRSLFVDKADKSQSCTKLLPNL